MMKPTIFFTIVANNYIAYAETLMESVAQHQPQSRRLIILCDEMSVPQTRSAFAEVMLARDLGLADFQNMAFHYDVMELSTAVKPSAFLWLLDRFPGAKVVYLDPDILLAAPLVHVEHALDSGSSLVLTPHITAPLQDGQMPDDLSIMKSGVYNLGFAAFRGTPESIAFLNWWRDRCERDAVVDIPSNKFTDQRWMDMAPAFVRKTRILHHHSYNLAYWNLLHRSITVSNGKTLVDGEPLRFVHFSGVDVTNRMQFSKHQNRFAAEQLGALRPLFDAYVDRLVAHGWAESSKTAYAYGTFASGRSVHPLMRLSFQRCRDTMPFDPARGSGAYFDQAEPRLAALGPPAISRLMHELWHRRSDLRHTFDVQAADGRTRYLDWFVSGGAAEAGLDDVSVASARSMQPGAAVQRKPLRAWPAQCTSTFKGARQAVDDWLASPVPLNIITDNASIPIPRSVALMWEARDDLSRHFPCRTPDELKALLMWCITTGAAEQSVDLDLVAPTLSPYFATAEEEGTASAPPLTRLMRLSAALYDGPFPHLVHAGPPEESGRIALALWLVGRASRVHGWPGSFTAQIRTWLRRRSPAFGTVGPPFSNLVGSLWLLCGSKSKALASHTIEEQMLFLSWVLNSGLREMELDCGDIGHDLRSLLSAPVTPTVPGYLRFHVVLWSTRADLKRRFNLGRLVDQQALVRYISTETEDDWSAGTMLARVAPPPTVQSLAAFSSTTSHGSPGRILLTGHVTAVSGRGEDVRMSAAALQAVGMPSTYLDRSNGSYVPHCQGPEHSLQPTFKANIVHLNADTALVDRLFLRRFRVANVYTIGFWAWELSSLPSIWKSAFAYYDEIWASTRFAYEAFAKASNRPVFLMSMAVEMPNLDRSLSRADFGLPQDSFIYYFGFDFRSFVSRKNPEGTILAFRIAFPVGTEKAALVIKTLGGACRPAELAALRRLTAADSRIILLDHEYSSTCLATLVSLCDCFMSLHRSEGFGRGLAEAMLLGKPVIGTNYSGNIDFMNARNSLLVDYKLVRLAPGEYPGWEHQEWADPDPVHAALLMNQIAADDNAARRIGKAASHYIRRHYSTAVSGAQMMRRLSVISGAHATGNDAATARIGAASRHPVA